jgi:hypothetical protein
VVVGIVLVLVLAGCAALSAEPMIALIGNSLPVTRVPASQAPVATPVATPRAAVAQGGQGTTGGQGVAAVPSTAPAATASPAATPAPTRRPRPTPKPTPRLRPRPQPGPFEINLYRRGDFVSQYENYWCTAAAMQVMVNIMDRRGADQSQRTQERLYHMGRKHSTWRLDGKGIEPEGIAGALQQLGYGKWKVHVTKNRYWAIRAAVIALRNTNRPVAMTTWRGAHTWVISGFRATADPAWTNKFEVTHLVIQDVWYPRVSSIWGASNPPNTAVPVERLPEDYLPFDRPNVRYPGKDGNFLMIIPETRARR